MNSFRAGLLAAVGLALAAMDAHALVACRVRNGTLAVRETCRRKESAASLADVGLSGPQGSPGATGQKGRAPLYLVDAHGTEVGPALWIFPIPLFGMGLPNLYALVDRTELGGAGLLSVGFLGEPLGRVYYPQSDCGGSAMIQEDAFLPVLQVLGDTAFRATTSLGTAMVASTELDTFAGGCTSITSRGTCCQTVTPYQSPAMWTASSFTPFGFVAPFHAAP